MEVLIIIKTILGLFTILLSGDVNCIGTPPQIKEHPKSMTIRRNDPATLNCGASDATAYRWYKNGQPLVDKGRSHRYFILDNGALFFLRVTDGKKENDSGVYWCEVINEQGSVMSRNATLTVATIDSEFLALPPADVLGRGGDPLNLSCRPPNGIPAPEVKWKRNNHQVENSTRVYTLLNGDLVFEEVKESDAGSYVCIAHNIAGSKESSATTLQVIYSPWFEERPQNLTALAGSAVEFNCRAKGTPSPSVSWRRPDGKIPMGRTEIAADGRKLRIADLSSSDSGTYICEAKNDAGLATAFGTLFVVAAPEFKIKPNDALDLRGKKITLKCQVRGDPKPLIIWKLPHLEHSSHLLAGQTKGRISVTENANELSILASEISDSGFYHCWGVSSGGGVASLAEVIVVDQFPPPIIGVRPKDQYVSVGSDVSFPCEVVSEMAEPTITWSFKEAAHLPDKVIVPEGSFSVLPTGALVIKKVLDNNFGIYKCRVTSDSGTVEADAVLRRRESENYYMERSFLSSVPAPPSKPKIVSFNSTSVHLSWLPNSRDYSAKSMTYTIEYWRSPWREWRVAFAEVSKESCFISDLLPNSAYVFLVRANNGYAESFPSPWSNVIYAKDPEDVGLTRSMQKQARRKLNKPSVLLKAVNAITADTVELSWEVLEENEMELDGVIIYTIGNGDIRTATVLGEASSSHIRNLQFNTEYTFFLVPFWRTIKGVPSNSKQILTPEEAPVVPPRGIVTAIYNEDSIFIRWSPLTREESRGNILRYKVSITYNGSTTIEETKNPWLEIKSLIPERLYIVKVAGITKAGIGPWSAPEPIKVPAKSFELQGQSKSDVDEIPSVLYAPPHPGWLVYLLVPILIMLILGILFYLKKFRRKSTTSSLEPTSGPTLYSDPTIYSPHHQHVNMYSEQKLWRPTDSDKDSSLSSTRLLKPEHLVNEYAEPKIQRQNDGAEPYATTALLAPSTPRIGRTPASWRHGRCAIEENGIQVNWAALLPPPPSCPPPPNIPLSHEGSCSSATGSSESEERRCCSPQSQYENTDAGSEQYDHPCDVASEHTYAAYSPAPSEDTFPTFCTLQGRPIRRVRVDFHPERLSEPPKSNTH